MVSNLFGTIERMHYLFRDTLDDVRRLVELKIDPTLGAATAAGIPSRLRGSRRRCGRKRRIAQAPSSRTKRRSTSCRS